MNLIIMQKLTYEEIAKIIQLIKKLADKYLELSNRKSAIY
jgi:hypothetical protein